MPNTGSPATGRTVVRVLYDDENVCVGAVMYDEHPERITVHSLEREFEPHDSDVFGGRLQLAGSTRLFGSAYVQYNEATDEVISNVRVNFIHAPLSDVFPVYRKRRNAGGGAVKDRRLTAKVTRLFAF